MRVFERLEVVVNFHVDVGCRANELNGMNEILCRSVLTGLEIGKQGNS